MISEIKRIGGYPVNIRTIAAIFVGLIFIISGFTKAMDPLGLKEIFKDYFFAFELRKPAYALDDMMTWSHGTVSLVSGVLLSAIEFMIGLCLLLGVKIRYMSYFAFFFMVFFTPLTLFLAIYDPFSHCGCFGNAIILSNWETFIKNIIILIPAILIFINKKEYKSSFSCKWDWVIMISGFIFIIIFSYLRY